MEKRTNIVVVDDDESATANLRNSLSTYTGFTITGEAKDAFNGKRIILERRPDLLFLDVELPDMNGVELLLLIKEQIYWPMRVIFYTAYEKYLLAALRASAFDYLLKPYEPDEFQKVINRYLSTENNSPEFDRLIDTVSCLLPQKKTFLIATLTGYQLFKEEQIGCFDYDKQQKQWSIISSNPTHSSLKRTTRASDILQYSTSFVQINQHQIININHLYAIINKNCQLLPPFDKITDLHISRICMKGLQDRFSQL